MCVTVTAANVGNCFDVVPDNTQPRSKNKQVEETINTRTPAIIGRSYTETKPRRYSVMPRKGRRSPPYPATEKWSPSVNPRLR